MLQDQAPDAVRRSHRLRLLVVATIAGGALLLVASLSGLNQADARLLGGTFLVVAALVLVGELRPVVTGARDLTGVATSSAFVFAVLAHWGLPAALLVQSVATVVAAVVARRALWRTAFDVAQHTLAWGAAAAVLALLGRHPSPAHPLPLQSADLPPLLLAGAAYFVVNNLLVCAALGLHNGAGLRAELLRDLGYRVTSEGALLALSPLVVVALERGPAFVPLLALPLFAFYATASVSVQKEHQATHDTLTGLPNRKLLLARMTEALADSDRTGTPAAVFLLDLDRFKEVNDTLGHHVGDALLQIVGRRLANAVRPGDTVARLGGDEFALLLPTVRDQDAAHEVAERVHRALGEQFRHDGTSFEVEASIGVALYPRHGEDVESLLRSADSAMYVAKEARTRIETYDGERHRHAPSRLGMLAELRAALEDGQLVLHYQPKAELRTGEVVGLEALLRWQHPVHGLVEPAEFLPFAERSGLMFRVTQHVVETAVAQLAEWTAAGLRVQVAVNVSARDLHEEGFAEFLCRRLYEHGVAPSALQLEVTESVVMADPDRAAATLEALSAVGVGISLDDFGTGYSSLVHLRRLPVDEVKVDRSFVARMDVDEDDAVLVRSIIDLGSALGLRVVAEGVETRESWDRLTALGCDAAQGWYFAAALPPEVATEWLLGAGSPAVVAREA